MIHGYKWTDRTCFCEICDEAIRENGRARRRSKGARTREFKNAVLPPRYLVDEGPACVHPEVDPEWFFVIQPKLDLTLPDVTPTHHAVQSGINAANRSRIANAKAVCAGCPIREQCLEDNLTADYGIFGGLTAPERHALTRQRGIAWPADGIYVDEVAVDQALHGLQPSLTRFERAEARRRMERLGYTPEEITERLPSLGQTEELPRSA